MRATRLLCDAQSKEAIEDPVVIEKILNHLEANAVESEVSRRLPCRAPPQRGLFD